MTTRGEVTTITVPIIFIQEEGGHISAYCPVLDLAGQGDSEESALDSFQIVFKLFIEETRRQGTLHQVLTDLGWTLVANKKKRMAPPLFSKWQKPAMSRERSVEVALPAFC